MYNNESRLDYICLYTNMVIRNNFNFFFGVRGPPEATVLWAHESHKAAFSICPSSY